MPKSIFLLFLAITIVTCTSPVSRSAPPTPQPTVTAWIAPTIIPPAPTPKKLASSVTWIEVDLTRQVVVLHEKGHWASP